MISLSLDIIQSCGQHNANPHVKNIFFLSEKLYMFIIDSIDK